MTSRQEIDEDIHQTPDFGDNFRTILTRVEPVANQNAADLFPETAVFLEDGLFLRFASYSQGKELLRMCSLTRSDIEQKCKLVLSSGGIRKDERRSEPVDDDDSWMGTLRERIALDKRLVFTAGDASVMKHNQQVGAPYPSRLIFSLSA